MTSNKAAPNLLVCSDRLSELVSECIKHLTQHMDQVEIARATLVSTTTISRALNHGRIPGTIALLNLMALGRAYGYPHLAEVVLREREIIVELPASEGDGCYVDELLADTVAEGEYVQAMDAGDLGEAERAARTAIGANIGLLLDARARRTRPASRPARCGDRCGDGCHASTTTR